MPFFIPLIAEIVYFALLLFLFALWGRLIIDLVRAFQRGWRPRGGWVVVVELVYTITDPPIRFFRRLIPPLSFGGVGFDFGWTLTMLCVIVLMTLVSFFR